MDEALTPVAEEDSEHMELYTQNEAARVAVERERRVAGIKAGGANGSAVPAHQGNVHEAGERSVPDRPRPTVAPPA
jgi:hypothetical protein